MRTTIEALQKIKTEAYKEGASDILSYLEEVYGQGIHQTDVWVDYMGACDCCTQDEEE
jgi:Fe-S cluster biogenesis protein NfuA